MGLGRTAVYSGGPGKCCRRRRRPTRRRGERQNMRSKRKNVVKGTSGQFVLTCRLFASSVMVVVKTSRLGSCFFRNHVNFVQLRQPPTPASIAFKYVLTKVADDASVADGSISEHMTRLYSKGRKKTGMGYTYYSWRLMGRRICPLGTSAQYRVSLPNATQSHLSDGGQS